MPIIFGKFGNKRAVLLYPIIMANEKGGMNNKEFKKYIAELVTLLYTNVANIPGKQVMIKIDGGPGRIQVDMLLYLKLLGVFLYPTIPNNTTVQQETDQNCGLFQSLIQANLKILFAKVRREDINLNKIHYPILINGPAAENGRPAMKLAFDKLFLE